MGEDNGEKQTRAHTLAGLAGATGKICTYLCLSLCDILSHRDKTAMRWGDRDEQSETTLKHCLGSGWPPRR